MWSGGGWRGEMMTVRVRASEGGGENEGDA